MLIKFNKFSIDIYNSHKKTTKIISKSNKNPSFSGDSNNALANDAGKHR